MDQEIVAQEATDVADTDTDTNQESSQTEYSDSELKALDHGWKPKEDFDGDDTKWVDANEFNRRGELFEKIDVLNRENKETKKALKMLQEHHTKVRDTEYTRALTNLKAEKKSAYEEGNADRLIELDDEIADVKAAQKVEQQAVQQQVNQPDPRFTQWVERNSWYAQDTELRSFADAAGTSYANANPNKDPSEVLDYVTSKIKKAFPEKFTNPNRNKPSNVEGGSPTSNSNGGKKSSYQLTEDESRVMNTFVRQGIMTKEEYIDQLKQIKGVA